MKIIKKSATAAILQTIVLVFLVAASTCGTGAADLPDKMIIGYQAIPHAETVAKDLGWIDSTLGIPIKWVKFDSGRHVIQALASGSVDIGLVGTSPCAAGISKGIEIEAIWIHHVIGDSEALVVVKGSGIQTIKDLVGKRVAVPFGSTTHYHLMVALKLSNVKPDQLTIINLEPEQMPVAWQKGDIDAGFVWEPTQSKLLGEDGEIILSSRQLAERGFPTADLCAVRKEFAQKYPNVVITYLRVLDKAVKFVREKPDEAAAAIARQFNVSPELAARQMKGLIPLTGEEQVSGKYMGDLQFHFGIYTTLKETADFLEQAGQIESSAPWPVFMRAVNPGYVLKSLESP
jgi:taurine transport system substrate-binding protein